MGEILILVTIVLQCGQTANKQVGKEEGNEEDRERGRKKRWGEIRGVIFPI